MREKNKKFCYMDGKVLGMINVDSVTWGEWSSGEAIYHIGARDSKYSTGWYNVKVDGVYVGMVFLDHTGHVDSLPDCHWKFIKGHTYDLVEDLLDSGVGYSVYAVLTIELEVGE